MSCKHAESTESSAHICGIRYALPCYLCTFQPDNTAELCHGLCPMRSAPQHTFVRNVVPTSPYAFCLQSSNALLRTQLPGHATSHCLPERLLSLCALPCRNKSSSRGTTCCPMDIGCQVKGELRLWLQLQTSFDSLWRRPLHSIARLHCQGCSE